MFYKGIFLEMTKEIELKINSVIEETTRYDFPFLASRNKKEEIIQDKKTRIEEKLKELLPDSFPSVDEINKLWAESIEVSDEQFEFLSEKNKLNGFYLQELMHCYAEKIGKAIIKKYEDGR